MCTQLSCSSRQQQGPVLCCQSPRQRERGTLSNHRKVRLLKVMEINSRAKHDRRTPNDTVVENNTIQYGRGSRNRDQIKNECTHKWTTKLYMYSSLDTCTCTRSRALWDSVNIQLLTGAGGMCATTHYTINETTVHTNEPTWNTVTISHTWLVSVLLTSLLTLAVGMHAPGEPTTTTGDQ